MMIQVQKYHWGNIKQTLKKIYSFYVDVQPGYNFVGTPAYSDLVSLQWSINIKGIEKKVK